LTQYEHAWAETMYIVDKCVYADDILYIYIKFDYKSQHEQLIWNMKI